MTQTYEDRLAGVIKGLRKLSHKGVLSYSKQDWKIIFSEKQTAVQKVSSAAVSKNIEFILSFNLGQVKQDR